MSSSTKLGRFHFRTAALGVHIESVNTVGQTSLFCASYGGDYEIVELLLRLGANPNRRCGSRGAAPIHAAAYRGSRRVFRLLVEAGADLTLLDAELQTPRQYAEQQPSPLRRQKILEFFDFLYAMTLHRAAASTLPDSAMSSTGVISEGGSFSGTLRSSSGTLKSQKMKGFLAGSQLSLARKHSQSTASLWSSCISEAPSYPSSDETDSRQTKEVVLTENLHKNISCHLIDQLCVTTSLPLLTPDQLQRPNTLSPAYTCGGPTVYSSYLWLGTPVTVRRPTPALLLNKQGQVTGGNDKGIPDADAVGSLLQELSFLRRLRHPGFLEVMAACHVTDPSPDHVTLVFQHVPYGSLYHHLHVQHHDLSVGNAVDILIGLVEALLFLHVRGWFHCGLSSHALHLVSLGSARLGGFENALEAKVKGVGMRADHLTRAPWLMPWQAPETLAEKMMSVRSEVYSIASIIWEIWSGMPPWAGIEEEEIAKRVGSGEMLPPIKGTQLSLVCYLTQYGLRWNAHERELDLQEVHTMLRSLRIQCNEEERVPAVTSWGPPSIPNTPLICRQKCKCEDVLPLSTSSSSGELRLGDAGFFSVTKKDHIGRKCCHQECVPKKSVKTGGSQESTLKTENKSISSNRLRDHHMSSFERAQESVLRQFTNMSKHTDAVPAKMRYQISDRGKHTENKIIPHDGSRDSGFSTPCSRTPSPTYDTVTTARSPAIITSTPARSTASSFSKMEKQPDILPNKITPKAFMASQIAAHTPDLVTSQKNLRHSSDESLEDGGNFNFITSPAKRAFLEKGEEAGNHLERLVYERRLSDADTAVSSILMGKRRQVEVIKRGLSLTNLCSSTGNTSTATTTVVTRTTSHISLCSMSSSSSGETFNKKPIRTISQITLTLKKLSASSSSYSSLSRDDVTDGTHQPTEESTNQSKQCNSPFLEVDSIRRPDINGHPVEERRRKTERNYNEIVGIKPASHQLTRHSSSCSLGSGPPSPNHPRPVSAYTVLAASRPNHLTSSHGSLPTSPTHSKFKTVPPAALPLSVFSDPESLLKEATTMGKLPDRRHSETTRYRVRRSRRKHDVEVEEQFIDDEFNSLLYDQPHMQLSVGSAENLLDSRLSFAVVDDSASTGSPSAGQHSCQVTSSDDDEDISRRPASSSLHPLNILEETGDSDNAEGTEGDKKEANQSFITRPYSKSSKRQSNLERSAINQVLIEYASDKLAKTAVAEEDVFLKSGYSGADIIRDYEPLKSIKVMKNLEKSLTSYLPTYSIGSDSD